RLEFPWRARWEGRRLTAPPDGYGRFAQRGDRFREPARREAGKVDRGHQPDERRQQEAEGEILPLLPNALVVQQLRHGQHSLLTGGTRRNDEKADAGRPAAGARVDGRLELILERAPEDLGSEKWSDQTELPQHGRARGNEYATAIQPQFGVEPAAQLDEGASDHLRRILGHGFGAGGGVAERLANEQIAGATSILGQVGKAPGRKSKNWQDEKCDEHRRELRAITGAQCRNHRRQPRAPPLSNQDTEEPDSGEQGDIESDDENAAHQQPPRPAQRDAEVYVAHTARQINCALAAHGPAFAPPLDGAPDDG